MGVLEHQNSGTEHILSSHNVVGRETRCDLCLDDPLVSMWHAELRWNGTMWEIRDLDSANGTFVDGRRIEHGERVVLDAGNKIAFGSAVDCYELADDAPPCAAAIGPGGERQFADAELLAIPSPEDPQYTIFQECGRWIAESSDGSRLPVTSRSSLQVGDQTWRLDLPVPTNTTLRHEQQVLLRNLALRFLVTRDEEHVEVEFIHRGRATRLPSRVYWYMLLILARTRLDDAAKASISVSEQGWMTAGDLAAGLGIDTNLLYQYICRARKMFSKTGVLDFAEVIERRPGSLLRVAIGELEVETL